MQPEVLHNLPPLLLTIFNSAETNCMLLLDQQGIIIAVNDAFTKNFGYGNDDIAGQSSNILFTEEDQVKGMPQQELQTVLTTGQCSDNNYLVAKDGRRTWVSGESIKVVDAQDHIIIIKTIQNIHIQVESAEEIRKMYHLNENILARISDAVAVVAADMQIIKFNNAFLDIFYTSNHPKDSADIALLLSTLEPGGSIIQHIKDAFATHLNFRNHIAAMATNGDRKLYEISGSILEINNNIEDILLVFHDITLQQQIIKEREDIIGFVAHEVRNPLSNIGLCNELMEMASEEKNFEQIPELIRRNSQNIARLNKMTTELYNATKIGLGSIVLETNYYHFGQMILESVDNISSLQPDYTIHVSGDGDFLVEGDRYRMMEVVHNFLSNGIKYSNGRQHIFITIERSADEVIVAVKDHGLGIPSAQLPFIFDRFFRAEKTRDLEGLGLGLYLCQRIINAHKGRVWAESEEGKGSTFYFSVPLQFN